MEGGLKGKEDKQTGVIRRLVAFKQNEGKESGALMWET